MTIDSPAARIEFVRRGPWYALDGEPLLNGDLLEVQVRGQWHRGIFLWAGDAEARPILATPAGDVAIPSLAAGRWPHASGPVPKASPLKLL